MFKRLCQLGALAFLSAMLVFAPEIFTAVSTPYQVSTRDRVLLRVVLCSQDADAASAVYDALEAFRKEHPAVHLRVTRADEAQLSALADPPPDVYVYPPQAALSPEGLFRPLEVLSEAAQDTAGLYGLVRYAYPCAQDSGAPLLCAVSAATRQEETALALASRLSGAK